ncbi:NAD(P)H-dependent oxidoreductase [Streptomyces sp. TRM76323]|uniref:NAD(P)H-dependent oxidoreductase n=1 Tax=Streptomyces tamarix TaxID=3078565 RepID=A0ABU3QJZ9_9ACTN|nr:NAD(P)H-dependent oxidoreductase [Streptomyces tamarix]MDT9683049.1 NAD(P)H-dependent oxidoreductase [Streptomyces tamarix]
MDLTTETTPRPASSEEPLKLAVIVGSNREGRFAPVVTDWFVSRVRERADFTVDIVDLAQVELPTNLSYDPPPAVRAELAKVSPQLGAADAFVVLTPEYNHSYPASLKALVDWHFMEWQAKPIAFVSYGGVSGGLRAVEHLRQVFAELHAVTVRDTVSFSNAGDLFNEDGGLKDSAGPDGAAKKMLDQLGWWGRALRTARDAHPYEG